MLKVDNTTNFWSQYSSKESDFENEVRRGIWFRADDATSLPEPPEGYKWMIDSGRVSFSSKVTYRLWAAKFGYMPGSK